MHKRQAARWALDNFFRLREAQPVMPEHLNDRAKDNWRPLFAVAAVAGGDWPDRARQACRLLTGGPGEDEELGVQLLGDIREIVGVQPDGPNWIPTRALVERLWDMEDHPWVAEVPAKSAGSRLAQLLRPFGIRPKAAWQGSGQFQKGSLRGYYVKDFQDAFARYLPQRDK